MSNPIHVVLLLALFAIGFGQAYLAGRIAERKGRAFAVYFIAGLFIGPLALLGALLVPKGRGLA